MRVRGASERMIAELSTDYVIGFSQGKRMGCLMGRERRWDGMVVVKETFQVIWGKRSSMVYIGLEE